MKSFEKKFFSKVKEDTKVKKYKLKESTYSVFTFVSEACETVLDSNGAQEKERKKIKRCTKLVIYILRVNINLKHTEQKWESYSQ